MSQSSLHPLIAARWSPRAFSDRPIEPEILRNLFDAARWAASSFNEQPWRFIVATKREPEQFELILNTLVEKNKEWAKTAWALGISTAKKTFSHNGSPDRFGPHDTGAALANLMIQATADGLHVHGMGGFNAGMARNQFGVPEDFDVEAAFAIGYTADDTQPGERSRKPLDELVFGTSWGNPYFKG